MDLTVSHHRAELRDSSVHYVTAGAGEPVVLLHGWPQTWFAWHKIIPTLAKSYFLIAPDLRGLGDSSRPAQGYDKKTVAQDIHELLSVRLKLERVKVVGHDWGGPVAFALAAFHPGFVEKLVMLDAAVPGDGSGTFSQNGKRWHHAFHQSVDLPEQLLAGREEMYYRWFYQYYGFVPGAISETDIREYMRTYCNPETVRTGLSYYRSIEQDIKDNAHFLKTKRLPMPVLALGGDQAFGRGMETLSSLQRVAENVVGGVVPNCGHWLAEEQPDFVVEKIRAFFG